RAEEVEDGKGEGSGGVPCSGLRRELLDCLRESDCVKIHGMSPRECLQDGAPGQRAECNSFRLAFFECKRSLV
ncbi:Cytochrome c oxidase assembly factor 5, partial [Geodia barretti]